MNCNFNWDAFSAISTAIGSFATAGAFIFTFHELRLKSSDKISIYMNDKYIINTEPDIEYIGVSVTNTGYLPTKVKYICFTSRCQKKKHSRLIFKPISENFNKLIDAHLEEFFLLSKRSTISEAFKEDIKNKYFKENEYVYISVVTSMKIHYKRTKLKFKDFL